MGDSRDWLPRRREAQLTMLKNWLTVLQTKAAVWQIPAEEVSELTTISITAQTILTTALSSEQTSVITSQCKVAFTALTEKMRFIKRRYFLSPPLTESDFTALDLKPHDTSHTPRGKPRAQMTAEIGRSGTAMLILKMVYAEGTRNLSDPRTDIVSQIRWGKYSPVSPKSNPAKGEIAGIPTTPEELPMVLSTRRKKEIITFEWNDSGKTVYFAIRIGNGNNDYGPWCPLFSAVIP
ncbi:hypothetical protein FACS1894172_16950 [Spirochaetia bacterium]|nr:hypothetical protein FACS1894164_08960 [Spirochaetia bacterium]GHU35314.1 hypothetical protein FACS1894172_16950 [Spirochaetia bacterium]